MASPEPSLPPVVNPGVIARSLGQPDLRVVDCRFDLDDPDYGAWAFGEGRIPGAAFVDLGYQLSATVVPGRTGRHPLPSVSELEAVLSSLGIGPRSQVVAYDDFGGAFAAWLWWILRWLGHDAVSVLDGGWPAWCRARLPTEEGEPCVVRPTAFVAHPREDRRVDAAEVLARLGDPALCLVDARSPERFRGEVEPRDPVAGCIPGARNAFWKDNLGARARFLSSEELRARFDAVLTGRSARDAIFYCGSGVTGAHDLLAMAHAGLPLARLYAGSWSHWITEPERPIRSRSR